MDKLRSIVRNSAFEKELRAIEPHIEKADEFLEGVEMVLARLPECGHRIGNSPIWFIAGLTVDLAIYYTFDEDRVVLLSICKTKPIEP
jgi:hypothetical protein